MLSHTFWSSANIKNFVFAQICRCINFNVGCKTSSLTSILLKKIVCDNSSRCAHNFSQCSNVTDCHSDRYCALIKNNYRRNCYRPSFSLQNFYKCVYDSQSDFLKYTNYCCVCIQQCTQSNMIYCNIGAFYNNKYRLRTPSNLLWINPKEKLKKNNPDEILDHKHKRKTILKGTLEKMNERENIWTVPNFLCISRIVSSPILSVLLISGYYDWCLFLFLFAGFTDLIDGWIARAYPSQSSHLGSFLDPLADKILVATLFLSLTYCGFIPVALTGLIIYRDVLIIIGASYIRYKSLPSPKTFARYFDATHATARLSPTFLSKFNTGLQLCLITASLAAPVFSFVDHTSLHILWWITAISTVGSGLSYIFSKNTYKILGQKEL